MVLLVLISLIFLLLFLMTVLASLAVASALISILALRLSLVISIMVLVPVTLHNSQLSNSNHRTIFGFLIVLTFLTRMLSARLLFIFCPAFVLNDWLT